MDFAKKARKMTVVTYRFFCAIAVNILRSFLWPSSPSFPVMYVALFSPLLFGQPNFISHPTMATNDVSMGANFGSVGPLLRCCKDATKGPMEPWIYRKKLAGSGGTTICKYITHASDWAAYHLRSRAQVSSPLGDPDCDLHFKIRRPAGNASSLSPGKG